VSDQAIHQLRLASGLVLFAYIALHLTNHALGVISLDLAERGLGLAVLIWQSRPGTVLLYGAAAVHFGLALRTVFLRRHWNLPLIETIRLASGFSLPLLLIGHVVTTRVTASFYDVPVSYGRIVALLVASGSQGWQLALLAPGWLHGSLGLWITLRRRPWAQRLKPVLSALVLGLPLLAALGFLRMTREVDISPAAMAARLPPPGARPGLLAWQTNMMRGYLVLVGLALVLGQLRRWWIVRPRRPF
jgi:adenylate cyclase